MFGVKLDDGFRGFFLRKIMSILNKKRNNFLWNPKFKAGRNPTISQIDWPLSFLLSIHVCMMGTSPGAERLSPLFPPTSPSIQRAALGSWSYQQVGYCSWRLLKCRRHNGDSMFHWSRLWGVLEGEGQAPIPMHKRSLRATPSHPNLLGDRGATGTRLEWGEAQGGFLQPKNDLSESQTSVSDSDPILFL